MKWYTTEDVYDVPNTGAEYASGTAFDRLHVEQAGQDNWLVLMCVKSEPIDEFGSFSFDFFPDDEDRRYTIKASTYMPSVESAKDYAESMDEFVSTKPTM